MKNQTNLFRFRRLALFAVAVTLFTQTVFASMPKKWSELSSYLKNKYVTVIAKDGTSQRGRFVEARRDVIVVDNGTQIEIPRGVVFKLQVDILAPSNLGRLGSHLRSGYRRSWNELFSPLAPVGIIDLPAVTAYAVVAAPFCALGDLFGKPQPSPVEDITILPDPK